MLWADSSESRAAANLRTALWRLPRAGASLVRDVQHHLRLDETVLCDLDEFEEQAFRVLAARNTETDLDFRRFGSGLLVDWDEPWLRPEQERVRQLRLAALEHLSGHLVAVGRPTEALAAAMVAYNEDPLRETATRAVIESHLARGNRGEARRHFDRYCGDLRDAFGLGPSPVLDELIDLSGLRGRASDAGGRG